VPAAAPPLERRDDLVHAGVDDALLAALARLRDVVEDERAVVAECDVAPLERGEAVAAVLAGVLLAADPEEAAVEQADRARQHPPAGQAVAAEVARGRPAKARKRPRELHHPLELLAVAARAPAVVVAVLAPPGRVGADRLQVAVRVGTDPDVRPGRRDRERGDPLERRRIDAAPRGAAGPEAAAPAGGGDA